MKNNPSLFVKVFLVAFILFFFSPGFLMAETEKNSGKLYEGKITIGAVVWPGYLGLYVAAEKGYFKAEGLNVEIRTFASLRELSKEYTSGKMQGRANPAFDAVTEHLNGFDHRVVLAVDYSNGADAILAGPEIQSVQDFKGKRVGYEYGTMEEFFLVWALEESALQISDILPVNDNPEETPNRLKEGAIDVAVTYEPFASKLIVTNNFHRVYSTAQAPGLITDLLTFRTDFIRAYPDTIRAILRAYFKAIAFWKAHPEEANAIIAKEFKDTPESIAEQLKGIKILDERDNRTAFTFAAGLESLYGNMRRISVFISKQSGKKYSLSETDKLVEKEFVKETDALA